MGQAVVTSLGLAPARWPDGCERTLTAEPVAVVEDEGIFGKTLRKDADDGGMIEQSLEGTLVAFFCTPVDFGFGGLDFCIGEDGGDLDPSAQVEEEFLFVGHGNDVCAHVTLRCSLSLWDGGDGCNDLTQKARRAQALR